MLDSSDDPTAVIWHTTGIRDTSDAVRRHLVEIEVLLERLDQVGAELGGQWTGEAQQAFAAAHREWSADLAAMVQIAHRLLDGVGRFAEHADAVESGGAAVWQL